MKYFWFSTQFLTAATSFAWACLLPVIKPFIQPLLTPSPRLVQLSTMLLLSVSVFLASSFRFGDSPTLNAFPLIIPTVSYGLEHERFVEVETFSFAEEQRLRSLLTEAGMKAELQDEVSLAIDKQLSLKKMYASEARYFYEDQDRVRYIAVPFNAFSYLRVDLSDGQVTIGDLEGVQTEYTATTLFFNGNVDSTLKYTLLDVELQEQIRLAFTKEMPLDTAFRVGVVKVIYTVKSDQAGAVLGYGGVEALRYRVNKEDRTSIRFADAEMEVEGFFNPDGSPVQQTWLASPIPGARISSPYNLRRLHPILKRIKPHYGTDYAAPYGTPILAVSDGVVVARDRNRGNGNYLKIRHNGTYQSQYLHMKGFASGMKPGAQVKKGQVIGYVGSTGLSNGPHVCFRFWKDGRQVDHRKEHLPTTEELTAEALSAFEKKQAAMKALLDVRA